MASTILEQILENISRGARLPSMAPPRPTPPTESVAPMPSPKAVEDAGALMREVMEEMDQRLSRMVEQVLTHPALGATSAPPPPAARVTDSPPPLQGGTEAIDERRAASLQAEYGSYGASPEFDPIVPETRSAIDDDTATAAEPAEAPRGSGEAYSTFPVAGSIEESVAAVEPAPAESNAASTVADPNENAAETDTAWADKLMQSVAEDAGLLDDDDDDDDEEDEVSIDAVPEFDLVREEEEDPPAMVDTTPGLSDEAVSSEKMIESAMPTSAEELRDDDADGFALDLEDLAGDIDTDDIDAGDINAEGSDAEGTDSKDLGAEDIHSENIDGAEVTDESSLTKQIVSEIEGVSEDATDADSGDDDESGEDESVASLIGGNEPTGERLLDLVGDVSEDSAKEVAPVTTDSNAIEQVEAIVEEIAATCGVGDPDGETDVPEAAEAVVNPALAEIRDLLVPLQSVPSLLERQGAPTQQILRQMQVLADEVRELARAPRVVASNGDEDAPPPEDTKASERRRVAIDDIQGMIQSLS